MVLSVAALMAAMLAVMALPTLAQGLGPSVCQDEQPGQFISNVAQEVGKSADLNPGNAKNTFAPVVPFGQRRFGCNPTDIVGGN